jgi:hypothetical protein
MNKSKELEPRQIQLENMAKDLKERYNLTDYKALRLAAEIQRNIILYELL